MERVPHENIPSEFPDHEHWCGVRAGAVARSAGRCADAAGNGPDRGGARLQGRCHEGRQDEVPEIRSGPGLRGLHAVPGQEGLGFGPVRRVPRQAGVGEGLVQRFLEDGLRPVRHRAMPQCGENRNTLAVVRWRAFFIA
ncbi:hypothetical protein BCEN4_1290020 [Burkholderia cenocepacia]|nr:hypothetical protein BCEN4_1290020 [Burkholderia cenocepacia]